MDPIGMGRILGILLGLFRQWGRVVGQWKAAIE